MDLLWYATLDQFMGAAFLFVECHRFVHTASTSGSDRLEVIFVSTVHFEKPEESAYLHSWNHLWIQMENPPS